MLIKMVGVKKGFTNCGNEKILIPRIGNTPQNERLLVKVQNVFSKGINRKKGSVTVQHFTDPLQNF